MQMPAIPCFTPEAHKVGTLRSQTGHPEFTIIRESCHTNYALTARTAGVYWMTGRQRARTAGRMVERPGPDVMLVLAVLPVLPLSTRPGIPPGCSPRLLAAEPSSHR